MSDDSDGTTGVSGGAGSGVRGAATGALVAGPVALALGLLGGLVVGAGATWLLMPESKVEVPRPPTDDELKAACAAQTQEPPATAEEADSLSTAQTKVATLERDVATKERRVKELEDEMAKRAEKGKELVAQLQQTKTELATAKKDLAQAESDKNQLLTQLRSTEVELATTKTERDTAREDALFNRWNDFIKNAQLDICDKGNRKKLGNCREAVDAAINTEARQAQYSHCIRSKQAAPIVQEKVDNKAPLPTFAEMINEDAKQTKGWMVIFCDPTLPEAANAPLAESHLPTPP